MATIDNESLLQDLYNFQMALQEIDGMRVNGKFVDAEGNVPAGQLVSRMTVGLFVERSGA